MPSIRNIQRQPGMSSGLSVLMSHPDRGPPTTTEIGTASITLEMAPARWLRGIH